MAADTVVQLELSVGDTAHQINATARAFVFVARLDVRRACRRAQPAMHAVEQQLVVERGAGIGGTHVFLMIGHKSISPQRARSSQSKPLDSTLQLTAFAKFFDSVTSVYSVVKEYDDKLITNRPGLRIFFGSNFRLILSNSTTRVRATAPNKVRREPFELAPQDDQIPAQPYRGWPQFRDKYGGQIGLGEFRKPGNDDRRSRHAIESCSSASAAISCVDHARH